MNLTMTNLPQPLPTKPGVFLWSAAPSKSPLHDPVRGLLCADSWTKRTLIYGSFFQT